MRNPIPWPTSPSKDQPQRAGIGTLTNVILEQLSDGTINRRRAPGISPFTASAGGSIHCRGFLLATLNTLLVIYNGIVESLTVSGSGAPIQTSLGALDGTKIVSVAKNNKTPIPDIPCITENGAFILSTTAAPAAYPDANVGSPNSVTFGDGYFFFTYGNGVCIASALNGTAINLLNQITINSASDGCVRGIWFAQTLFLFTPSRCEAWSDTANPIGFPFSRSAVIPRGLINNTAIAGYEDGFTSSLMWVGNDNIVYLMRGYAPYRLSNHDIERRIQAVADKQTLRANVYMNDGHAFWQLSSSDFTITYDLTNSIWLERKSYLQSFSRIEQSIYAFGKWLVGDFRTGNIGFMDGGYFNEYLDPFVYELTSLPVTTFRDPTVVERADFNFITGTGGVTGGSTKINPVVDISWSDDGGASFKMPVQRELGKQGQYGQVVSVLRGGQTSRYGRVWKLKVSDPVYVGLLGATMDES